MRTMHGPDGVDYPNVITYRDIGPGAAAGVRTDKNAGEKRRPISARPVVFERTRPARGWFGAPRAATATRRRAIEEFGAYEGGSKVLESASQLSARRVEQEQEQGIGIRVRCRF